MKILCGLQMLDIEQKTKVLISDKWGIISKEFLKNNVPSI